MPMHDWTRVPAGIYHHFHQKWAGTIADALNDDVLPRECYALAEQYAGGLGPDVLTLRAPDDASPTAGASPGTLVKPLPPRAKRVGQSDLQHYAGRQNTVIVRHVSGDRILALIEVVSPGNKGSSHALDTFLRKAAETLERGYHLLVIDPFPPGERDPQGIHGAIWSWIEDASWRQPEGQPLTVVSYEAAGVGGLVTAYAETLAVGGDVPEMPLFLWPEHHVPVPLEQTYQRAWHSVPLRWRRELDPAAT